MTERDAYTIEQVRERLGGMSRRTIERAIRRGEIRTVLVLGRRLVPADEVQRLLTKTQNEIPHRD